MKVSEIIALQALPPDDKKHLFTVGRYLILPANLRAAIGAQLLGPDEKFTPSVQERLLRTYVLGIKRLMVKTYITGSSSNLLAAQSALAREFSTVADPSTGRSY